MLTYELNESNNLNTEKSKTLEILKQEMIVIKGHVELLKQNAEELAVLKVELD